VDTIWSVVGIVGGAFGVVVLIWAARTGLSDRKDEDEARDFFDAHGRWPDEPA
jgi:hypothetical protein